MIKFTIYGPPIPLARHRSCIRNGHISTYDIQAKQRQKVRKTLILELSNMLNGENKKVAMEASNLASGDYFSLTLSFYLPIPVSIPQGQKNLILWGLDLHIKKPDVSNMIKFYEDAANEVLFPDDSKVVSIEAAKYYSATPRTEIMVEVIKKTNDIEMKSILSIFSPENLGDLFDLANDLTVLEHEMLKPCDYEIREKHLGQAAYLISKLADKHADVLKKVKNKSDGYWKKSGKVSEFKKKDDKIFKLDNSVFKNAWSPLNEQIERKNHEEDYD